MTSYEIRYCKVRARRGIKPWGVFRIDQEPGLALGLTQHWTEAEARTALATLQNPKGWDVAQTSVED